MDKVWRFIQEDRVEKYRVELAMLPVARTPQDKSSAGSLQKYIKSLERMLDSATPWVKRSALGGRGNLSKKVEPGKTVVLLGAGEQANNPLYADATIKRE